MPQTPKTKIAQVPRLTTTLAPRLGRYFDLLPLQADQLWGAVQDAVEANPFLMVEELKGLAIERPSFNHPKRRGAWDVGEGDGAYQDRDAWLAERPKSLQSHLLDELRLHAHSERDFELGLAIIGEVNEDGFLEASLEDIAPWVEASPKELEDVLERVIFKFEPAGIGARDLREALAIQIRAGQHKNEELLLSAVARYLDLISKRDAPALSRKMNINEDQASEIIDIVETLEPVPARSFQQEYNPPLTVDLVAEVDEERIKVAYAREATPKPLINREYVALLEGGGLASEEERRFLREKLASAKDFLWAFERRQETVLAVAQAVLEYQRKFFTKGDKAMRPLKLSDIAEGVGYSISTVSRAVAGKKVETPLGIFRLKFFFSPKVSGRSRREILMVISRLVEQESPGKPLVDKELVQALSRQGIEIARRTVAKYRRLLGIPPASRRRRR